MKTLSLIFFACLVLLQGQAVQGQEIPAREAPGQEAPGQNKKAIGRVYEERDYSTWTALAAPVPPKVIPVNSPPPSPPKGQIWKQTFADEFDGTKIDTKKWNILGDKPRKSGFWLKKQSKLDDRGHLVVSVDREPDPDNKEGLRTVSGGLETRGKFEQAFGYFECRYKMLRDNGSGYHCAFWLQSDSTKNVTGDGRNGTEIDIIEKFHHDAIVQHCLHWDGTGEHHDRTKFQYPWPGIKDGFHIFALKWTPTEYTFYIDGVKTWTTDAGGVSQVPAFIRLTAETSQGWNGDIEKATLPDEFVVDYLRVYKLEPDPATKLSHNTK